MDIGCENLRKSTKINTLELWTLDSARLKATNVSLKVLRGTGIRVQTIVISYREWNETPAEIAAQYDLPEAWSKRL